MYTHEQAIAVGFLDEIVAAGDLRSVAIAKAEALGSLDATVFQRVKQDLRGADIKAVMDQMVAG